MKIENIFITGIEVNSEWDEDGNDWVAWEDMSFRAYGKSKYDTSVHLNIKATDEEREAVFKLMERVTKRVREEGE